MPKTALISFCGLSYDRLIASSKGVLHRVWSSAFCFNFQYLLFSLTSSSSCLGCLPRLPVVYILPSNFPSITCFRRRSLPKIWPIQLAFLLFVVRRIFLSSLTVCKTSSFLTRSVRSTTFQLPGYFWFTCRSVHVSAQYRAVLQV
jgi:hypothetical protein